MNSTPLLRLVQAWKVSLDKKRDLITSLAKAQKEIEDCEGSISAMLGEKKTAMYHNDYYYRDHFIDNFTAIGKFKEEVSQITFKPFSWTCDWKKTLS